MHWYLPFLSKLEFYASGKSFGGIKQDNCFFTHKDALETIFLKSTLNSLVSETNAW